MSDSPLLDEPLAYSRVLHFMNTRSYSARVMLSHVSFRKDMSSSVRHGFRQMSHELSLRNVACGVRDTMREEINSKLIKEKQEIAAAMKAVAELQEKAAVPQREKIFGHETFAALAADDGKHAAAKRMFELVDTADDHLWEVEKSVTN